MPTDYNNDNLRCYISSNYNVTANISNNYSYNFSEEFLYGFLNSLKNNPKEKELTGFHPEELCTTVQK